MSFDGDWVIQAREVSKHFEIYNRPADRLKQMLFRGKRTYFREFRALKKVSFQVKRGETVGIIGKNGSGKSTLLQIIAGTMSPTLGAVQTRGRVAALLELGSGFNPEFTGRENIFLNGAVLGLSQQEIQERYEDIIEFAGIGEFIDQPVKTYSSGMMVRLAFAVQAQVCPDILIVDEALAVGDVRFQAKCFAKLKELKANGTSILLVTHSGDQIVTHCDRAVLLDEGEVLEEGEPRRVVNRYMDLLFGKDPSKVSTKSVSSDQGGTAPHHEALPSRRNSILGQELFETRNTYNSHEYRWGDGRAKIVDYLLESNDRDYPRSFPTGSWVNLSVGVRFLAPVLRPILGFTVKNKEGVVIYGANSETLSFSAVQELGEGGTLSEVALRWKCNLAPGDYFISLGLAVREGDEIIPIDRRYDSIHIHVEPDSKFFGLCDLGLEWVDCRSSAPSGH
jgi:lipopolysaccharide transport system ATP-binding protein